MIAQMSPSCCVLIGWHFCTISKSTPPQVDLCCELLHSLVFVVAI